MPWSARIRSNCPRSRWWSAEATPICIEVLRQDFVYRLLGKTRDDAAGEAFDKVAKLLGFGYPGGPVIDMLAPHGDPHAVPFTLAKMKGNTLDFSFSGIKTAVLRWTEARDLSEHEVAARRELCFSAIRSQASTSGWLSPPAKRSTCWRRSSTM
jgi:tRNA A37 threonylcarbamoyltransferase TsaD